MLKSTCAALLVALSATLANAQITLTAANLPAAGTVTTSLVADSVWTGSANIGAAGPNQTWDFSNVQADDNLGPVVTYYQLPSQTPYAAQFPTASLASRSDLSDTASISYMRATSSEFALLGQVSPTGSTTLAAPWVQAKFPFTYNTEFSTNTTITIEEGGVPTNGTIQSNTKVDAWGTVKTPLGSFPCLRAHTQTTITLTIFGLPVILTTSDYAWWTASHKAAVLTHSTTSTNFLGQVETAVSATYLSSQTTGIFDRPDTGSSLAVAPNPATDMVNLNIQSDRSQTANVLIYSTDGKLVREISDLQITSGKNQTAVEISDFAPGIYMAMVTSAGKTLAAQRIVKQ